MLFFWFNSENIIQKEKPVLLSFFFPNSPLIQYNLHTAALAMSVSKTWGWCGGGECYIKSHRNLQKQCGLSYEENYCEYISVSVFQMGIL